MLIGQLRAGDRVGHGVTIGGIRRIRNGFSVITLSTGTQLTLHKTTHVAGLMIGHIPAESLDDSRVRSTRDVRASDKTWRGENVGERGERFIARCTSHGSRAMDERRRQGR